MTRITKDGETRDYPAPCPVSRARTGTNTPRAPSGNRDYDAGTGTTTPRAPSGNRDYLVKGI